jgi:hypothetical protein
MPIVRIRWDANKSPTAVPGSLVDFLRDEAGMDSAEAVRSAQDLIHGRSVEAYFDLGENEAATAFSQKLAAWGLETHVESDKEIEKADRITRLKGWVGPAIFLAIVLVGAIIQEPWYGVILFLLALGGIVFFFVIRSTNRRN